MQILHVFYDGILGHIFHETVELEGYTITSTKNADEAIRILEEYSDESFLLFADNTIFNAEAMRVFAMVRTSPHVRRRVRIIGWNGLRDLDYLQERADGTLDDFLPMPHTVERLLGCIATNAAQLPD